MNKRQENIRCWNVDKLVKNVRQSRRIYESKVRRKAKARNPRIVHDEFFGDFAIIHIGSLK